MLRQYRAIAHKLNPVVRVGGNGLSTNVLAEVDRALGDHELIKIKVFGDDRDARVAMLEEICEKTGAIKVHHIGKQLVIYRQAETAKIIAKELELSLDDATRMMKGTEMVPCDKQLTQQYMGTTEDNGGFVDTLVSTGNFLYEQKRLPAAVSEKKMSDFIHPEYLESIIK